MKNSTKYYLSIEEKNNSSEYLIKYKKEIKDLKIKKRIEIILEIFENKKYGLTVSQRELVSRVLCFYDLLSAIDDKELIDLINKFE